QSDGRRDLRLVVLRAGDDREIRRHAGITTEDEVRSAIRLVIQNPGLRAGIILERAGCRVAAVFIAAADVAVAVAGAGALTAAEDQNVVAVVLDAGNRD